MTDARLTRLILLVGLALCAVWALVAFLAVPPLIASAYRGESLALLNSVIEGRDVHLLSTYLGQWAKLAKIGLLLLSGAVLALALVTRAEFQRLVDRLLRQSDATARAAAATASMSPSRRRLANSWILFLLLASLACIVLGREVWPFSHYAMYAHNFTERDFQQPFLFGVLADSSEVEIDLLRQVTPFDNPRLRTALLRIQAASGEGAMRQALGTSYALYEKRRQEGAHHGPPIVGLRYYLLSWQVDPWARNRAQPSERKLVAEWMRP